MQSKAAVLWGPHTPWSVEETELDAPRFGEVRVKLAASGLCHSDDHFVKGDIPCGYPIIGGHEGAGVVEEVGPGVKRIKEGDAVVLAFMPACGHCRWCASGKSMLCDYGAIIMDGLPISDQQPRVHARGEGLRQVSMLGTFAPYVVVNEDSCVKVDDDTPLEYAALVGCGVTTGYGAAVKQAKVEPGDTVVVVGTGGVGSSAVQGARIAGAEVIVAVDPFEYRREQAKVVGATHAVASMAEATPLVTELTRGVMADKTILTASLMTGDMLMPLMLLTRKGGRACLTSTANPNITNADVVLADVIFSQKEIVGNVYGGCNPHADIPRILSLYRRGLLKLDELVSKTYALEQVNEGYDDLLNGRIMRGLISYS
ncbi:NDMA-dependent alcohol dehydrogenase [Amycolatopsis alkalitolerans]|uniref:NDMA-dependent alcohol dehydrogenase n=1 Tax=Amycolatopsis alkalitolerans TaxID=2547244 RepID=A0A5C4LW00_9PSEU|nr:NDMA-dependent alcohol dehydrogenase [Amycolatopsis alkalitolerans]TNC20591.1 NDMA-dependent alcohol dehydrogenase [Amycolatopsis alkalitolerans]